MVSCIIPFHNEKGRVDQVIEVLLKTNSIDEIICVNDASTDDGEKELPAKYPSVKFINLKTNVGKSHAIKYGLNQSSGEYLLLMDADLQKLNHTEIDTIIQFMKKNQSLDMLLLKDLYPHWITQRIRHDIILSGKRILKAKDLHKVFSEINPQQYQIEIGINTYMTKHKKKVSFTTFSCKDTVKIDKIGLLPGTLSNLRMMISIITFPSFLGYVQQLLFFGHDEVRLSSENGLNKRILNVSNSASCRCDTRQ